VFENYFNHQTTRPYRVLLGLRHHNACPTHLISTSRILIHHKSAYRFRNNQLPLHHVESRTQKTTTLILVTFFFGDTLGRRRRVHGRPLIRINHGAGLQGVCLIATHISNKIAPELLPEASRIPCKIISKHPNSSSLIMGRHEALDLISTVSAGQTFSNQIRSCVGSFEITLLCFIPNTPE